jgi:hypothetical protein
MKFASFRNKHGIMNWKAYVFLLYFDEPASYNRA